MYVRVEVLINSRNSKSFSGKSSDLKWVAFAERRPRRLAGMHWVMQLITRKQLRLSSSVFPYGYSISEPLEVP